MSAAVSGKGMTKMDYVFRTAAYENIGDVKEHHSDVSSAAHIFSATLTTDPTKSVRIQSSIHPLNRKNFAQVLSEQQAGHNTAAASPQAQQSPSSRFNERLNLALKYFENLQNQEDPKTKKAIFDLCSKKYNELYQVLNRLQG